jgi:hypothetical protein
MNAKRPRRVGCCGDDASFPPADEHRFARQVRVFQYLDGGVKGI